MSTPLVSENIGITINVCYYHYYCSTFASYDSMVLYKCFLSLLEPTKPHKKHTTHTNIH